MPQDDDFSTYPALFEKATNQFHAVDTEVFVVGRHPNADLPLFDQRCSRQQFDLRRQDEHLVVHQLSKRVPTYCNHVRITAQATVNHGDVIVAGNSAFVVFEFRDTELLGGVSPDAAQSVTEIGIGTQDSNATMLGSGAGVAPPSQTKSIPIQDMIILGRGASGVNVRLEHPLVSRKHVQLQKRGMNVLLKDLRSSNGTFVNGKRIPSTKIISPGDQIGIGPYSFTFDGEFLSSGSATDRVQIDCTGLTFTVDDGDRGRKTVLNDASLSIGPKEFVCIIGPSGSGKSTLLGALSARRPAEIGDVRLNGLNLYTRFDELKHDLAIVSQKNTIHEELKLKQALAFTARLRLPADTSSDEAEAVVTQILEKVGLTDCAKTRIKNLSGGQKRRACLANEMICQPRMLFLDEVTSGLDEATDGEMMQLFRQLADDGKTVLCVTHNLTHVEANCHRIVVMLEGGLVGFIGTPKQTLRFFGAESLGSIYLAAEKSSASEWHAKFVRSAYYRRQMQPLIDDFPNRQLAAFDLSDALPARVKDGLAAIIQQAQTLQHRYFCIQLAERNALVFSFAQAILVGIVIVLVFHKFGNVRSTSETNIAFLLAISSLWFGCNNSAREIVKEQDVYRLERDVNLSIPSYLLSKVAFLGAVGALQSFLLLFIVCIGTPYDLILWQIPILMATCLVGVSIGLLISAASKSNDMATSLVPLVLIPQVILSGGIEVLHGLAKTIAIPAITCLQGFSGLCYFLDNGDPRSEDLYGPVVALVILGLQFAGFISLAAFALWRQDALWGLRGERIAEWIRSTMENLSPEGSNDGQSSALGGSAPYQ